MNKAKETRIKREGLNALVLLVGLGIGSATFAQNTGDAIVDHDHAEKFGHLIVQDFQGRFKPLHTLATDLLKKVHRSDSYDGQSAMQVFLGIHTYIVEPSAKDWAQEPLIYVTGDEIREELNLDGKYAAIYDFFDPDLNYVLAEQTEKAYLKKPSSRSKYDKDLLKTDERFNTLLGIFNGVYFRIFPKPDDPNHKWYTPFMEDLPFAKEDKQFVESTMQMYFAGMIQGYKNGKWSLANQATDLIDLYQRRVEDKELLPSKSDVELEVLYNKIDVFKKLNYSYLTVGFFLLFFAFLTLFKPQWKFKWVQRGLTWAFWFLFVMHGLGLGVRWYLSGHAPWSNGYEAVVFIAFVAALAGLVFSRKNKVVLGATGILVWLLLFVAHMSNMDPQISNLVPVLKSYWLQIHVSVITGSYAFLGLGAILGLIVLVMYIFINKDNEKRIKLILKELTYVSEMTIIIGLFMLTIGTFLGGVWANESWGRYWGWDAKETWALASVLIYAVVMHLRFVPGLKGQFTFNFMSLWAYGAIIMTFFGVNFYLSGLHSYATGDPIPIPLWVPITIVLLALLSSFSYLRYRKFYMLKPKKSKKEEESSISKK